MSRLTFSKVASFSDLRNARLLNLIEDEKPRGWPMEKLLSGLPAFLKLTQSTVCEICYCASSYTFAAHSFLLDFQNLIPLVLSIAKSVEHNVNLACHAS